LRRYNIEEPLRFFCVSVFRIFNFPVSSPSISLALLPTPQTFLPFRDSQKKPKSPSSGADQHFVGSSVQLPPPTRSQNQKTQNTHNSTPTPPPPPTNNQHNLLLAPGSRNPQILIFQSIPLPPPPRRRMSDAGTFRAGVRSFAQLLFFSLTDFPGLFFFFSPKKCFSQPPPNEKFAPPLGGVVFFQNIFYLLFTPLGQLPP